MSSSLSLEYLEVLGIFARPRRTASVRCAIKNSESTPGSMLSDAVAKAKDKDFNAPVRDPIVVSDSSCGENDLSFDQFSFTSLAKGSFLRTSVPSLVVDSSHAFKVNEDQETTKEQAIFLEQSFRSCVYAIARAGFFRKSRPQTHLFLHPPVYTCGQAHKYVPHECTSSYAGGCAVIRSGRYVEMKNLFVRDKKKRAFLISACSDTEIKLRELKLKGAASGGLSFASNELLWDALRLLPGSVSPFGLLNDKNAQKVTYYLDDSALNAAEGVCLGFHPNASNGTLAINKDLFVEFIEHVTGHEVNVLKTSSS